MRHFEPGKKISEGSTAEAFLARSEGGDQVLLRVLRSDVALPPELVLRFMKVAKVCETLDDPGMVRHLGAGRLADGRLYLATEYLVGDTLAGRLARGPITAPVLARIAIVLCRALEQLHRAGLLYRDLTPEHVVLTSRPKLLDFGLSMFQGSSAIDLAPEVIAGAKPDHRSDLYTLGLLFHQALTGTPLFDAPTRDEVLARHLREAPPPVAGPLGGIVVRCLAKDPARRFASAADVASAIELTLTGLTAPAPIPVQKPGDRLGAYELVKLLGEGSIGRVFEARHVKLGRRVAIKVLKSENVANQTTLTRFFNEARAVNQINHPHIVEVSDFVDEEAGAPVYCVMELLSGQTLREALQAGPVPLERVRHIVTQVCDALGAAHATGVVHRDLKPDNIFLATKGGDADYVKVLDFGVAKLAAKGSSLGGASTTGTQEGAIVGTPTHMAPEQVVGDSADARTDVYAVGTVMYQLLAGRLPFEEQDFSKLAMQVIKKPAPEVPELNPAGEPVPEALRALVARCLAKEPDARPASVAEVATALVDEPVAPAAPAPAPSLPPWRQRPVLIAAGVTLAVLAGVALVVASRPAPVVALPPTPAVIEMVTLTVVSTPRGAAVTDTATGKSLGVTPLTLRLPREDRDLNLRLELAGYGSAERAARLGTDVLVDVPLVDDALPALPETQPKTKAKKKKKINANGIIDPFEKN